jgi:histidyl-tRNA synthetase
VKLIRLFLPSILMSNKPSLAKGTRDFGPTQVAKRKFILNTIEAVFKKYGFMPIETPAMENLSTLEGKYGDEGDQLLFRIINSGDYLKDLKAYNDSMLADESKDHTFLPSISGKLNDLDAKAALPFIAEKGLRYDLTVPFARFVVMNRNSITFPFKRYQMQPVWRADRPQKGRYREFWQCDADVVGTDSLLCEMDLIGIYHEAFTALRIPYQIKINNRKILAGIAQELQAENKLVDFTIALDKVDKIGFEGVTAELSQKGFTEEQIKKVMDLMYPQTGAIKDLSAADDQTTIETNLKYLLGGCEFRENELFRKGVEEVAEVIAFTKSLQPQIKLDLSLARGLSYYTGCILEVTATAGSLQSSIGGGGRYDNLTGIFGMPNVSGVGISFGLDRIYDVMEDLQLFPTSLQSTSSQVLVCCMDSDAVKIGVGILHQLRQAGIAAEIYPEAKKLGKQLDYANALNIPFAVIIGENERISGIPVCKNLINGTQQNIAVDEIISIVKSHSH